MWPSGGDGGADVGAAGVACGEAAIPALAGADDTELATVRGGDGAAGAALETGVAVAAVAGTDATVEAGVLAGAPT